MAKQVQHRRGTELEHSTFTGADGEITVDTTNKTAVVHDGGTVGGFSLVSENQIPVGGLVTKSSAGIVGLTASDADFLFGG